MEVADSPTNLYLGNFMVKIQIEDLVAKRPVLVNYKSNLLLALTTFWKIFTLFFGSGRESQIIKVPLIEDFVHQV